MTNIPVRIYTKVFPRLRNALFALFVLIASEQNKSKITKIFSDDLSLLTFIKIIQR